MVLQATQASRTFYGRFGFQLVGAVARYDSSPDKERERRKGRREPRPFRDVNLEGH